MLADARYITRIVVKGKAHGEKVDVGIFEKKLAFLFLASLMDDRRPVPLRYLAAICSSPPGSRVSRFSCQHSTRSAVAARFAAPSIAFCIIHPRPLPFTMSSTARRRVHDPFLIHSCFSSGSTRPAYSLMYITAPEKMVPDDHPLQKGSARPEVLYSITMFDYPTPLPALTWTTKNYQTEPSWLLTPHRISTRWSPLLSLHRWRRRACLQSFLHRRSFPSLVHSTFATSLASLLSLRCSA